jgi:hypothetical protein
MAYWELSWDTGDGTAASSSAAWTPRELMQFARQLQLAGARILSVRDDSGRLWERTIFHSRPILVEDFEGHTE